MVLIPDFWVGYEDKRRNTVNVENLRTPNRLAGLRGLGAYGAALNGQRFSTVDTSFDPETQVADTMPLIQRYASEDSQSDLVRQVAGRYAAIMPQASRADIAFRATQDHLFFQNDQQIANQNVPGFPDFVVEVLRRPQDVILLSHLEGRKVAGDCDDHSMFAAAVGAALGGEVKFITVAGDPSEPGVLSHIYVTIDGVPVDASHGDYAGWEAPVVTRRVEYGFYPIGDLIFVLAGAFAWYVFGPWIREKLGLS